MDGWTVIHYGQMEMEAVWKTEFLFSCDTLGLVSIQNGKKVTMLAFFNQMEMWSSLPTENAFPPSILHSCLRKKDIIQ